MSDYIFEPAAQVALPVKDMTKTFPVRRVYCIGRNYADHAIEMGHDPDREPPFFFQKDADNLSTASEFTYPVMSEDVHHEVELVVALKSGGRNIAVEDAMSHVFGYAVGLDMTRRDLQAIQKKMGRPWEIGKSFEQAAPIGMLVKAEEVPSDLHQRNTASIDLKVNGEIRQSGNLNQMLWKISEMISYLSDYFELAAGDVIFSGTPAGVGPVQRGDQLEASVEGLPALSVTVV